MSITVKEIREALSPIWERTDALEREIKQTQEFVSDVTARSAKARGGYRVGDNLKAALSEKALPLVGTFERLGHKDPVDSAAKERWLKLAARCQMRQYAAGGGEMLEEMNRLAQALGDDVVERASPWNIATSSEGGYTVPSSIEADIYRVIENNSIVRQVARTMVMPTRDVSLASLATHLTAYARRELGTTAVTASEPGFGSGTLATWDYVAYGRATIDVVQDSAATLLMFYLENAGQQIGRLEDQYALTGTAGDPCLGLAGQTTTGSYTIAKVLYQATTTATNTPTAPSLLNLGKAVYGPLHHGARQDGAWVLNPVTWASIVGATSSSVPLFSNAVALANTPRNPNAVGSLLGYDVFVTDKLEGVTEGVKGYFGSWRNGFVVGDRTGIDFSVSEHERFQYGEISMRVLKRTAMHCVQPHCFSVLAKMPFAV